MTDEYDERKWFFDRRTDKTIISKAFSNKLTGEKLRIASHIVEGQPGLKFAEVNDEVVLRQTPAGRYEIKATFFVDDRRIQTLTIQRFSNKSGPLEKQHFSFVGAEIDALLQFVAGIKTMNLDGDGKVHLADDALREIVLDEGQARQLFAKNPDIFLELAQSEEVTRDVVALGYRRKQLAHFEKLLSDSAFFQSEKQRLDCRSEDVWQAFFETNTWIFGYGLAYQFLSTLDDQKLEQIVQGYDVTGPGKRSDGLMKTHGLIGSLCFVEIKRHDTKLLAKSEYRSGVWPPSVELASGIAQVQGTVQAAMEKIGQRMSPTSKGGDPTGEDLFNIEPRSFLVIGSLDEFYADHGVNVSKFRSFELYRRNTSRPEVITFDELLERARFIVEHIPAEIPSDAWDNDDIPF